MHALKEHIPSTIFKVAATIIIDIEYCKSFKDVVYNGKRYTL